MGNAVSGIISTVPGGEEARREAEDVLTRLVVLSEVKATTHYQKITSNAPDKHLLPIEKIVRRLHTAHCCIQNNSDVVRDAMAEYLGPYLRPEIVDGLTAVIFKTLDSLMRRTSSKNSSEIMSYAVTMGKNGNIGRIDCYMFYYEFESQPLKAVLNNCLITSLVISQADTTHCTSGQMRALARAPYAVPLPGEEPECAARRLRTIEEMLVSELANTMRKKSSPI